MSFEETNHNETVKEDPKQIKELLKPHKKTIVQIYYAIVGQNPKLLFPSLISLDIFLFLYNQYDLGIFSLSMMVASAIYLVIAIASLFPQIFNFVHQEPKGDEENILDTVSHLIIVAKKYLKMGFDILFNGKILSPPVNIAAVAGIWVGIVIAFKLVFRFWLIFLAINIAAIVPTVMNMQSHNAQDKAAVNYPKVEDAKPAADAH